MDQEKTGKFIAHCRREKALTQAVLAEKLGITDRAVSKWETGKSLPDANIMLDLCDLLGISVTELLVGERITMENLKEQAENEMLEMASREKEGRKTLVLSVSIILTLCIFTSGVMMAAACMAVTDKLWLWILIGTSLAIFCCGISAALTIEYRMGYYKCLNCGRIYRPSVPRFLCAANFGLKKYMKCPNCKNRGWNKKIFYK